MRGIRYCRSPIRRKTENALTLHPISVRRTTRRAAMQRPTRAEDALVKDNLDYFRSYQRNALLAAGAGAIGLALFALAAPPLQLWNLLVTLAIGSIGVTALLWNHKRTRLVAGIVLATAALTPIAAPAGWAMMFLLGLRYTPRVTICFVIAGMTSSAGLFVLYLIRWANTSNAGLAALIAVFSILTTAGAGFAGIVAGHQRRRNAEVTDLFLDAMKQAPRISEQATQAERSRIARLLHDELGHNLALINLFVSSIETARLTDSEIREALSTIRDQNRAAARALANTVTDLTSTSSRAVLEDRLADIVREVERAGLAVSIDVVDDLPLSGAHSDFVVRTVREGLTNAVKYARPARADVTSAFDERSATVTFTIASPRAEEHEAGHPISSGNGIRSLQTDAVPVGGVVTFATDDARAYLTLMLPID